VRKEEISILDQQQEATKTNAVQIFEEIFKKETDIAVKEMISIALKRKENDGVEDQRPKKSGQQSIINQIDSQDASSFKSDLVYDSLG
jgi:hypothetical protein